ncbi:MAG: DinB family protein [Acidobacteria bacterium]|nr:DinB family protein [Acidobacteriota bacterium]
MNSTNIPADVQRILDALDANEREAQRLAGGLSAGQITWQPGNGASWSLGECLEHLTQGNILYAQALQQALAAADRTAVPRAGEIRPGWFARWFLGILEPPVKLKVKAPGKLKPSNQTDPETALSRFIASHDTLRSAMRDAAALDLNRICFQNPFFPILKISAGVALLVIPAHERRHLWQMKNLREAPAFPA